MTTYIQLHLLATYPPSNVNRDDLGRPKTAVFGGSTRARISSQSLKRSWRTSDIFETQMHSYMGKRTKRLGRNVYKKLIDAGFKENLAQKYTRNIAGVFGKLEKEGGSNGFDISQLCFISPEEERRVNQFATMLIDDLLEEKEIKDFSKDERTKKQFKSLIGNAENAVDIAMFGRMLADKTDANVEASVQVSHSLSVHKITVEDDYFTALDDLRLPSEQSSSHIGNREFTESTMYTYICINKDLLDENLGQNKKLASGAIKALIEAATQVSPSGMQNSFASRIRTSFLLMEIGEQQPRNLAVSFLKPVRDNYLEKAIDKLHTEKKNMDTVYGTSSDKEISFNVLKGDGSLSNVLSSVDDLYQEDAE